MGLRPSFTCLLAVSLTWMAPRATGYAQGTRASHRSYAGVTPVGDPSSAASESIKESNRGSTITWAGYQAGSASRARFFLKLSSPVSYEIKTQQRQVVLHLKRTHVDVRNNLRKLDTRYFATPVTQAKLSRRGSTARWMFNLRGDARPVVRQHVMRDAVYLFVYFEEGETIADKTAREPKPEAHN